MSEQESKKITVNENLKDKKIKDGQMPGKATTDPSPPKFSKLPPNSKSNPSAGGEQNNKK
ncbi:MAG: hypothetical protein ACFBSE_25075 [Prochloraceae cyanobacterium]